MAVATSDRRCPRASIVSTVHADGTPASPPTPASASPPTPAPPLPLPALPPAASTPSVVPPHAAAMPIVAKIKSGDLCTRGLLVHQILRGFGAPRKLGSNTSATVAAQRM